MVPSKKRYLADPNKHMKKKALSCLKNEDATKPALKHPKSAQKIFSHKSFLIFAFMASMPHLKQKFTTLSPAWCIPLCLFEVFLPHFAFNVQLLSPRFFLIQVTAFTNFFFKKKQGNTDLRKQVLMTSIRQLRCIMHNIGEWKTALNRFFFLRWLGWVELRWNWKIKKKWSKIPGGGTGQSGA